MKTFTNIYERECKKTTTIDEMAVIINYDLNSPYYGKYYREIATMLSIKITKQFEGLLSMQPMDLKKEFNRKKIVDEMVKLYNVQCKKVFNIHIH
jgi:hypothetical protein